MAFERLSVWIGTLLRICFGLRATGAGLLDYLICASKDHNSWAPHIARIDSQLTFRARKTPTSLIFLKLFGNVLVEIQVLIFGAVLEGVDVGNNICLISDALQVRKSAFAS